MLALPRLSEVSKDKRVDLFTQMGTSTPVSILYAKKLLSLEVKECADFGAADLLAACCAGLSILLDPSPIAVSACPVELRLIRNVVMGTNVPPPWPLVAEALEESDAWQGLKQDFRRTVTSDLTIGHELKSMHALESCSLDSIREACAKLAGWRARSRIGGTVVSEERLALSFGMRIATLPGKEPHERLSESKTLDELATSVRTVAFQQQDLKLRLVDITRRLRRACEETNQSLAEAAFFDTLRAYVEAPNDESWSKVDFDFEDLKGVKFVQAAQVKLLRGTVSAALEHVRCKSAGGGNGDSASCARRFHRSWFAMRRGRGPSPRRSWTRRPMTGRPSCNFLT